MQSGRLPGNSICTVNAFWAAVAFHKSSHGIPLIVNRPPATDCTVEIIQYVSCTVKVVALSDRRLPNTVLNETLRAVAEKNKLAPYGTDGQLLLTADFEVT